MSVRACPAAVCAATSPCSIASHQSSGRAGAATRHHCQLRQTPWQPAPVVQNCRCSRRDPSVAATQRERDAAASGSEPKGSEPEQRGNILQNLAASLLKGAASRLDRGTTTCLKCRGTGTVACTACKGHGVLEKTQVRMKTAGRVSNRCGKCGGGGRSTCTACKGRGFRGDVFEE